MKDIVVVVKILTYPHHLEEPQRFTMSPVKNMHPLILTQSCHTPEVLENCPEDWYANAQLSVLPRKKMMDETPSPHSIPPAQHHTDTFQQSPSKCTLHTYVTLEAGEEDMEEDSQTVPP